jgi:hypothetical protein
MVLERVGANSKHSAEEPSGLLRGTMTHFRICIGGRNHEAFTEQCLASALAQGPHVTVDWTDDASDTPAAFQIASRMLLDRDHRYEQRVERRGGLANLWHAIGRASDDDVCVLLGGDDWLEPRALERVAKEYEDPACWLTYGSYANTDPNVPVFCEPWDGSDPRPHDFIWMPLTCRAWLAKKILEEDLKIAGWWQWTAGDVALNVPMIEMAGPEHVRFIEDVWYTRRIHPQNDGTVDRRLQDYCYWVSYGRPRYGRLASKDDAPVRTPHKLGYSILFSPDQPFGMGVAY